MNFPTDLAVAGVGVAVLALSLLALARRHDRGKEPKTREGARRVWRRRWVESAPQSALPHYLPDVHTGPLF